MFHRRPSQKPSPGLLAAFRAAYPVLPRFLKDAADGARPPLRLQGSSSGTDMYRSTGSTIPAEQPPVPEPAKLPDPELPSLGYEPSFLTPAGWHELFDASALDTLPLHSEYWDLALMRPTDFSADFSTDFSVPAFDLATPAFQPLQQVQSYDALDFSSAYSAPPQESQVNLKRKRVDSARPTPRFEVTLLTGTSMTKEDDRPVSYIDRGQPYTIKVKDTAPVNAGSGHAFCRTSVRIDFHEPAHQREAEKLWNYWREEASGPDPKAIVYVPPPKGPVRANAHVEEERFDGFTLVWSVHNSAPLDFDFKFRCNFTSTDFSSAKGTKGMALRLYVENKVIVQPGTDQAQLCAETMFCKIKVFRTYGAERKLRNDEALVQRRIKKLEERIGSTQDANDDVLSFDIGVPSSESSGRTSSKSQRRDSSGSPNDFMPKKGAKDELPMQLIALQRLSRSKHDATFFFAGDEFGDD